MFSSIFTGIKRVFARWLTGSPKNKAKIDKNLTVFERKFSRFRATDLSWFFNPLDELHGEMLLAENEEEIAVFVFGFKSFGQFRSVG